MQCFRIGSRPLSSGQVFFERDGFRLAPVVERHVRFNTQTRQLRRWLDRNVQLLPTLRAQPLVKSLACLLLFLPDSIQQYPFLILKLIPSLNVWSFWHNDNGWRIGNIPVHGVLCRIAEKCRHGIEIFSRYGIKLMIVASCATNGQSQPNGTRGVHPVLGINRFKFFKDSSTLVCSDVATVETGGNLLVHRAVW